MVTFEDYRQSYLNVNTVFKIVITFKVCLIIKSLFQGPESTFMRLIKSAKVSLSLLLCIILLLSGKQR